ncbi:hypothetical protein DFH01_13305 [Falsiroseomonas bella]|uniref:Sel1 repeat family protein n=1 Tax=Falsiroseomonas bella TaxID=2184016 RepID=A0A317FBF8_9PROT|nr:hypothetical protein [Falsiroseomonas bella]PWS36175.1 hypothetical protein DFH01_13305 [Falsiroseomonas bella]
MPLPAPAPASSAPAAGFSVERLGSGWRLLTNCPLGGIRIHIVLIRPATGIALLEVEPTWHPEALAAFRARLEAAGFPERFPGHLPVIHRRLRPVDLPALEEILAEAFAWQDPVSIEGEGSWEDEVEHILTPPAEPSPAQSPVPASEVSGEPAAPAPVAATPARWRLGLAASLALACVAGGVAAISVLPRAVPETPAGAPGQAAEGRSLQVALLPAPRLPEGATTASDARTPMDEAAEAAEAATKGPPPDWADDPASPPPLPAAIAAPQLVAWRPPAGVAEAPPPRLPVASLAPRLWNGAVPASLAAPGPMERLPVAMPPVLAELPAAPAPVAPAPAPITPPPEAGGPPLPSAFDGVPPIPAGAPGSLAELPEPWAAPAPPEEPEARIAATAPAPETQAPTPATVAPEVPAPAPATVAPEAPAPTTAPPTAVAPPSMDPALRAAMIRRGQSLIAIGDISGARLFLERAARGGSADAAMALAETYDPGHLARLGVIGLPADPAAALSWYRRALALGAPGAAARIATLEGPR